MALSSASTFPQELAGYSVAWILMQYLVECAQMVHVSHSLIREPGQVIGVCTNIRFRFIVILFGYSRQNSNTPDVSILSSTL